MKKKSAQPPDIAALRRQAETRLSESRQRAAALPATEAETRRLLHELEVHQIELEMQNQELTRSRAEVEAGLKQYTDLYDFAPVGYFTLGRDGVIRRANLTGAGLLGMERARLVTRRFGVFVSADSRPAFNALLDKAFEGGKKETCEVALARDEIEPLWAHIEATISEDNQECHVAVVDITERKRAEQAIKDSREFSDGIVNTIREPLLVLRTDLHVLSANRSFYRAFKVKPEEIDRQLIFDLGNGQWNTPRLRELLEELLVKGVPFNDLEVEHEFPVIGRRTMLLNARKIRSRTGSADMLLLAFEDITERKKMEKALQESRERFEYKSFHDGLTGLYNRDYFSEQMTHLGKDLARSAPISIILIDIDGLKIVNDTLGHKAGDDLLMSAAKIISESFREVDIVSRIGGDEFCVILPGVDHKAALAKKNRISKSISLYNSGNPSGALNMSIGVATSQDAPGETIYDIYQRADENMYEFKLIQAESQKSKVIDILLSALSERDFVAQGHAERLSVMAELIAERIHLSDDQTKNLVLLAKLHDLGKVGIPDKILFKSRKLSEEEFRKMKEHAQIGYNLACRSKALFHISDLIRHHHEFWNGKGYTEGLKGAQIPLECRIFSILDAYDAMTNTRPYRKGISKKRAIKELQRCSGTQFEPRLVDEFVEFAELTH